MFFSPDGERGSVRAQREHAAKQICQECPVLADCRAHALTTTETYGIWGGLSESERARHTRRTRHAGLIISHAGHGKPETSVPNNTTAQNTSGAAIPRLRHTPADRAVRSS